MRLPLTYLFAFMVRQYAARNTIPAPWNLIMTYLPDGLNLSACESLAI